MARVLILGGTAEARQLAERLAAAGRHELLLSFAGRTRSLRAPAAPHRVGGFGGVPGLARFLREGGYQVLLDATHPFAAQISANAVRAAAAARVALLRLERPPWRPLAGDRWRVVRDMSAAAHALGEAPRRVFLAIGRQEVGAFVTAPQHRYLWRTVDPERPPPGLPHVTHVAARGPFDYAAELALLRAQRVEVVVSKNAGSPATYAKLEAARALGLEVVMVARPRLPPAETVADVAGALAWLDTPVRSG